MHPSIQQRPSASHTTDDSPPRIRWSVVLLLFAVATVARFSYFYFDDLARQVHGTLLARLLEEATGNIASALLFPIVRVRASLSARPWSVATDVAAPLG